jgi:hypothetical protein
VQWDPAALLVLPQSGSAVRRPPGRRVSRSCDPLGATFDHAVGVDDPAPTDSSRKRGNHDGAWALNNGAPERFSALVMDDDLKREAVAGQVMECEWLRHAANVRRHPDRDRRQAGSARD